MFIPKEAALDVGFGHGGRLNESAGLLKSVFEQHYCSRRHFVTGAKLLTLRVYSKQ